MSKISCDNYNSINQAIKGYSEALVSLDKKKQEPLDDGSELRTLFSDALDCMVTKASNPVQQTDYLIKLGGWEARPQGASRLLADQRYEDTLGELEALHTNLTAKGATTFLGLFAEGASYHQLGCPVDSNRKSTLETSGEKMECLFLDSKAEHIQEIVGTYFRSGVLVIASEAAPLSTRYLYCNSSHEFEGEYQAPVYKYKTTAEGTKIWVTAWELSRLPLGCFSLGTTVGTSLKPSFEHELDQHASLDFAVSWPIKGVLPQVGISPVSIMYNRGDMVLTDNGDGHDIIDKQYGNTRFNYFSPYLVVNMGKDINRNNLPTWILQMGARFFPEGKDNSGYVPIIRYLVGIEAAQLWGIRFYVDPPKPSLYNNGSFGIELAYILPIMGL